MQLIGLKNCDSTRKARKWLEAHDISFEFSDLSEEPLTDAELNELIRKVGLDTVINRRSRTWRELGFSQKEEDPSDQELKKAVRDHQKLIKRPILVIGESIMVGFDEDAYQNLAEEFELI